ncbi:response regulator transcription factor [Solimicrobium silvestre]|uniref:Response regulator containing a CheY-like receiver domain and an HTH DNA-binding domain n=1 Tax=Solimicrobium silvestre TaxID=2099400 RepID=A0A2S9GXY4_9BURK|nr:response regulator transcription factor [Solimicrobium silvestre]PRC92587.1 Response regulator containing a CheY-like receiver domain and an HTH DNA-binding domain [Solimicrobium silvestre]
MKEQAAAIRVLLADDHPIVMTGFAMSLQGQGIEVIGQAKTPLEAIQQYTALQPDVVILDIRFGEQLSGFDVAKTILQNHPSARIIFLSQFDQDSFIKEAYRLGGRAFVTKDCDPAELAQAVRKAHAGDLVFLPVIAERLANLSVQKDSSPQTLLDSRALTIFTLLAEGLTNAEIAEQLDISIKTVSNVSQVIKEKLGIQRQADLTKLALKHGLIQA